MTSCTYVMLCALSLMMCPFATMFILHQLNTLLRTLRKRDVFRIPKIYIQVPVATVFVVCFTIGMIRLPNHIYITSCDTGKQMKALVFKMPGCSIKKG